MRGITVLLLATALLAAGCQGDKKLSLPKPTESPLDIVSGVPLATDLKVVVVRGVAVVSWGATKVGASATGYDISLDGMRPVRVYANVRTYRFLGLKERSQHVVSVVTLRGPERSMPVTTTFDMPVVLHPVPNKPTPRPIVATARPIPTGKVLIDSYHRLPPAEQKHYGCDILIVTLVNKSTAAVDAVTVGFNTYWYPEANDPPPAQPGRNVTLSRKATIAVGAKQNLTFDVCLPEKKTRNVFAEPVATSWTWVR